MKKFKKNIYIRIIDTSEYYSTGNMAEVGQPLQIKIILLQTIRLRQEIVI